MKNYKKTMTMLLTVAVLLAATFMTGCKLTEASNNTHSEVDAPVESDGFGIYVKLERSDASSTWLAAKNNDLTDCLKKLALVDNAYQKLLTDEARELLDSAGCEDVEITWGSNPVEPVEVIMQTAGLRK